MDDSSSGIVPQPEARWGAATLASMASEALAEDTRGAPESVLQPDEEVGPYRVRRLLGRGGMGEVYLARHGLLGRLVALKIIRSERMSERERERFLREARTTDSLEHANIVHVHDVGTHRGAPYIALEYLGGESLAARLRAQSLTVNEALRIVRAIADALDHAHGNGVLHCDLKPSNVMLPPDGRPRVVDFGLSAELTRVGPTAGGGTPGYMAPEQHGSGRIGPAADVWSLGVILGECLGGRTSRAQQAPPTDGAEPPLCPAGVAPEVSALLQAMLAHDPSARPTAARVREVIDAALGHRALGLLSDAPFRGLHAFEEQHAALFHGRDAELDHACERLRTSPVLTVIGPSGVGKSSFVHAGMIARLRLDSRWSVITVRPGRTPFETIAARLIAASGARVGEGVAELAAVLRANPSAIAGRLAQLAGSGMVLLVVDQLEELFTHVTDAAERSAFLRLVYAAADDPREPMRVIVTIRDDFLGMVPPIQDVLVLGPLEREDLEKAVRRPVELAGYTFETTEMVRAMVDELGGSPSELPLLQFTCRLLWDRRDQERHCLRADVLTQIGGVGGALASHADAVLASLDAAGLDAARAVLLALVSAEGTRRVRDTSEISALVGPRAAEILDRLDRARVIVLRRGDGDGKPTVELAHEALTTRWKRLREWIDGERDERKVLAEIEAAAALWVARGQRDEETWTDDALVRARSRLGALAGSLGRDALAFLDAGEAKARAMRRRRSLIGAAGAAALVGVTIVAVLSARIYRQGEQTAIQQRDELARAGANLGAFTVTLEPFEWDPDRLSRSPARPGAQRYALRFHQQASDVPLGPGPELEREILRVSTASNSVAARPSFSVEAPGVPAVIVVERWDASGQRCSDSWITIKALPGFSERRRGVHAELVLPVPSCEASLAGMVEIPAGSYLLGGPADPPVHDLEAITPLVVATLDRYWIDRTELSNAAFGPLRELAALAGMDVPIMPVAELPGIGEPDHPIAAIDPRVAAAACALWGKRLPSFEHWVKATRGGLVVDGRPNPSPIRAVPWGREKTARPNLDGPGRGCPTSCSVLDDRGTASPYGVINLVGNVREWLAPAWPPPVTALVDLAGGGWATKSEKELHTTAFTDSVDRRYFDYQTGVRCVMVPAGPF